MNSESFVNTYNARHLNPRQVAETFIWSGNFRKLTQNNHSVILGARGCGKTTLMKMLTLPALYSWKDSLAESTRNSLAFYAIYVSTDIYWNVKNQTYGSQLADFDNLAEVISAFSVNTNVFKSLCETFRNIVEFEIDEAREDQEVEMCKILIKAWKLQKTLPKFDYVIDALNERVDFVNQLIQDIIFNHKVEKSNWDIDFFKLSFESSLEYVIPIFERLYGVQEKKKWALCFDELEFAPLWLQNKLFISLRSRTQYILYKLSSSPILSLELEKFLKRPISGTPGNDLDIIKMWSTQESEAFSRKIVEALLKRKNPNTSPEKFFGHNEIYYKKLDNYNEGSLFYLHTKELLGKDDSFRDFMLASDASIDNPVPKNDREKDILFRKIKPIVYFRNYYIDYNLKKKNGTYSVSYRSRKTSDLYSGIEVLYKVCDGNPRWLIALVNEILARSESTHADRTIQFNQMQSVCKRFENSILNIPIGFNTIESLRNILGKLGDFFAKQVLGSQFHMDPKGTFTVDESSVAIPAEVIGLLERGISQGAFILVDSDDESFNFQIRGRRFKLSYMLSLLYRLPLRKYPSKKLSECLEYSLQRPPASSQNQTKLF